MVASAIAFVRSHLPGMIVLASTLVLAGASGLLAGSALGIGEQTRTVTIDVATGPRGPQGPPGERGPAGPQGMSGFACPTNAPAGWVVINAPGGQVAIWTCIRN